MAIIYHLIGGADWRKAGVAGEVIPESLATEGFIHCSENEAQTLAVANRLYAGVEGMLVLEVDTQALSSPVKREPSRSGKIYPHIYGPIDLNAVAGTRRVLKGVDGAFYLEGE